MALSLVRFQILSYHIFAINKYIFMEFYLQIFGGTLNTVVFTFSIKKSLFKINNF